MSGSPQKFEYPHQRNLQFDSAKPVPQPSRIGKLLGILSLQALPRRITLDFRDVFSDGFAYDQIIGPVKVTSGIASTGNLRIDGPSARVLMTGEVDLARETQKLNVKVIPSIGDGVALLGGLLGGPLAGAGLFVAQKFLPLDQFMSYDYQVTGTWSEPVVTTAQRPGTLEAGRPE